MEKQKRMAYLDGLRFAAAAAVVMMHVISTAFYDAPVESFLWQVMNGYESLVRWPVPVFIMISGALLLNGTQSTKSLWTKYIPRVAAAFVFWSGVYALYGYQMGTVAKEALLQEFLFGHYHMWYLYFIAGLYVITPFLRKIVESRELTGYFLLMSLIFGNILPRIPDALGLVSPELGSLASGIMAKAKIYFFMGHVFYYVLGYALSRWEPSPEQRHLLYGLGIVGLVVTVAGTAGLSLWKGTPVQLLYNEASVHIALMAAAVFVFAKRRWNGPSPALAKISGGMFGVYLVHPLVIDLAENHLGLTVAEFWPVVWIPVLAAAIFAVSWLISWILGKIPVVGKYLV